MSQISKLYWYIDDKITQKLTDFCWYLEVKFNKNNVWVARKSFSSTMVFMLFISMIINNEEIAEREILEQATPILIGEFIAFALVFWLFYIYVEKLWLYLFREIWFMQRFESNARKSPNINKRNFFVICSKIYLCLYIFFTKELDMIYYAVFPSFVEVSDIVISKLFFLSLLLPLYILCTESVPKNIIKDKEEEKIKKFGFQYIPQKN